MTYFPTFSLHFLHFLSPSLSFGLVAIFFLGHSGSGVDIMFEGAALHKLKRNPFPCLVTYPPHDSTLISTSAKHRPPNLPSSLLAVVTLEILSLSHVFSETLNYHGQHWNSDKTLERGAGQLYMAFALDYKTDCITRDMCAL